MKLAKMTISTLPLIVTMQSVTEKSFYEGVIHSVKTIVFVR